MKRFIWFGGVVAALAILLAVFANVSRDVMADTEPAEHRHCICGKSEAECIGTAENGHSYTPATTETAEWVGISSFTGLNNLIDSSTKELYVYLESSFQIVANDRIQIPANSSIHLCLNGQTVTGPTNNRFSYLANAGVTLTICDCKDDSGRVEYGNGENYYGNQGALIAVNNGTAKLELYGGTLSGGRANTYGGCVAVMGGATFNMYGGVIENGKCNNSSNVAGGNVAVHNGVFNLYDGIIRNGEAVRRFGGNIYVNADRTFNMYGGTVEGGTALTLGGNIYADDGATVQLNGGFVKGGKLPTNATTLGGNICVGANTAAPDASLTIDGTTIENGLAAVGGNIAINGTSTVTMKSGTIRDGQAIGRKSGSSTIGGFGGNVAIRWSATFVMEDGAIISGGYAEGNQGGNVSISGGGSAGSGGGGIFRMLGGEVTGGVSTTPLSGGITLFNEAKDGAIDLRGGTVTGNKGGVKATLGKVYLSGNPVIKGNDDEFCLEKDTLEIAGPLTGNAGDIVLPFVYGDQFGFKDGVTPGDYSDKFAFTYGNGEIALQYEAGVYTVIDPSGEYIDLKAPTEDQKNNMEIYIYLIGGQSNASGTTLMDSAPAGDRDRSIYKNVHYYTNRFVVEKTEDKQPIPADNNVTDYRAVSESLGYQIDRIGPELGMASVLDGLYDASENKQALILKYAAGGTSVRAFQNNASDSTEWDNKTDNTEKYGTWYPTAALERLDSDLQNAILAGDWATNFLTRGFKTQLTEVYNELTTIGYQPENIHFVSLSWLQGESDRAHPDEFKPLYKELMQEFRDHLYSLTGRTEDQNLPIVMNQISATFVDATSDNVKANAAFIEMQDGLTEEIENYVTIPSSGKALAKLDENGNSVLVSSDGMHYIYVDIHSIGEMLATASNDPTAYVHPDHCEWGLEEPSGAHISDEPHSYIKVYDEETLSNLVKNNADSPRDVYVQLGTELRLTTRINLGSNVHLHLCLNGFTIQSTANLAVFALNSSATAPGSELTISDCRGGGSVVASRTRNAAFGGGAIYVGEQCTLKVYGGTVVGGRVGTGSSTYQGVGGCICLNAGSTANAANAYLYGGALVGGSVAKQGGSVFLRNSNFYMYGGEVRDGQSDGNGGNIYVLSGSLTVEGGKITNGTSNGAAGGNIALAGGTADIDNAEITEGKLISDSKQYMDGGNLYVSNATVNIGQNALCRISGGVVYNTYATEARSFGGNISVSTDGTLNLYQADITEGFLYAPYARNGFNVCVRESGKVNFYEGCSVSNDPGRYEGQTSSGNATSTQNGISAALIDGGQVDRMQVVNGTVTVKNGIVGTLVYYNGTVDIQGGYVTEITNPKEDKIAISGGYFRDWPGDIYLAEGVAVWNVNKTVNGVNYLYHVAPVGISNWSMTLEADLSLNFYAFIDPESYPDAALEVLLDGVSDTIALPETAEATEGYYKFTYRGVTADLMTAPITVTLKGNAEETLDTKEGVTIRDYLNSVIAYEGLESEEGVKAEGLTEEKEALYALIRDLFVYGREAGKKFGSAYALVVDESYCDSKGNLIASESVPNPSYEADTNALTNGIFVSSVSILHRNANRIQFTVAVPDGADIRDCITVTAGGSEVEYEASLKSDIPDSYKQYGTFYTVTTEPVAPTAYGTEYILTGVLEEASVATLHYSVDQYAYNIAISASSKLSAVDKTLAKALYLYGLSADAYVNAAKN